MNESDSPANYPIMYEKFNELFSSYGANAEILASAKLFMFSSRFRPNITKVRFKQVYDSIAKERDVPEGPIEWTFEDGTVCHDALKKFSHEYYQTIVTSKEDYKLLDSSVPTDRVASGVMDMREAHKRRSSKAVDMRAFVESSVNQYCRQRIRLGLMTEEQSQLLLKSLSDINVQNKITQLERSGATIVPEKDIVGLLKSVADPLRLWDEGSFKESVQSVKDAGSRAVEAMLLHGPTDGGETFTRIAEQVALDNPKATAEEVGLQASKLTGFAKAAEVVSQGIETSPKIGTVAPFIPPSVSGKISKESTKTAVVSEKAKSDPTYPSRLFRSAAKTPIQKSLAPVADAALSLVPRDTRETVITKSILTSPSELKSILPTSLTQSPVLEAYKKHIESMTKPAPIIKTALPIAAATILFTNPLSRKLFGDVRENTASYLNLIEINSRLPEKRKVLPSSAPLLAAFFPFVHPMLPPSIMSDSNVFMGGPMLSAPSLFSPSSLPTFRTTPLPLYMTFLPEIRNIGLNTFSTFQITIHNFIDRLFGATTPSSWLSAPITPSVAGIMPSNIMGTSAFLPFTTLGSPGTFLTNIPIIGGVLDKVFGGMSGAITTLFNRFSGFSFLSMAANFGSSLFGGLFGYRKKQRFDFLAFISKPDIIVLAFIGVALYTSTASLQYKSQSSAHALAMQEAQAKQEIGAGDDTQDQPLPPSQPGQQPNPGQNPGPPDPPPFPPEEPEPEIARPIKGKFGDCVNCQGINPFPDVFAYTCDHGAGSEGKSDVYGCVGGNLVAPFDGCVKTENNEVGGLSIYFYPTDPSGDYYDDITSNCPSIYFTHLSSTSVSGDKTKDDCIPVKQGQTIGTVGCTGNCAEKRTPAHTHTAMSTKGLFIYNSETDVDVSECLSTLGTGSRNPETGNVENGCSGYAGITSQIRADKSLYQCLYNYK